MPLFVLACFDKENALETRMATRQAHLAWAATRTDAIKLGGPMLDDKGDMAGSLFILDLPDKAAVQAFNAADPYTQAGLWDRVELKAFKVSLGQI